MRRPSSTVRCWALIASVLVAVVVAAKAPAALGGAQPQITVFARVPAPGYPADALLAHNGTVYAGTFHSFTDPSDTGPSKVFAFSPAGRLERTYTITGQTAGAAHGVQVATTDRHGLLYLLDQAPARVLRLNPVTGAQSTWATFATLPACVSGQPAGACTDGASGSAPEPDFATWGPGGALYVTDYNQDVIWRIPPGGGKARVWLTESQFDGVIVGPAGIELMPNGHTLMFDTGGGGNNISTGKLYTVPIKADGKPGSLTQIWQSGQAEAPDGFAIARSGHIYVALVGPSGNAVDELSSSGRLLERFPANAAANERQSIPFDAPGSVTFDGDRILVANQSALLNDTADMALLEVSAGEPGFPLSLPPRTGSTRARYRLTVRPKSVPHGRRRRFHFTATITSGSSTRPLARAVIHFDRRAARTNSAGHATIVASLRHRNRRYRARLVERHSTVASATVSSQR